MTIAATLLALFALIGACRAAPQPAIDLSRASAGAAPGRWDDLDGAIAAAQREHELAVLDTAEPSPGVRVYTLLSVLDERVVVRAQTPSPDEPTATAELDLAVSYGLWGDPRYERAIIQTIRRSLEEQRVRRSQRRR